MKKALLCLALAVAAALPLHAESLVPPNVFYFSADGNCGNDPCSLATARRLACRNSSTDLHIYTCDTSTGFFAPLTATVAPGGANTQINFNDAGVSGGDPGLTWDKSGDILSVTNGLKTPLKLSTNYTIANPTIAPTAASSAAVGSCTCAAASCKFATVWANLSGVTNISPASSAYTGVSFKKATITKSESVPPEATGWITVWSRNTSGENFDVWRTCVAGTLDSVLVAPGTGTYDCSCATAGVVTHGGTNQTGVKALTTINSVANGIIGMGSVGSTIGSVLENVHTLDMNGSTLKYDNATVGQAIRVVSVCSAGCQYTTLGAALTAETSTSAAPIQYRVGPGVYVARIQFSGEDHFEIVGSGRGVTTLQFDTTTALQGVLEPGNSTNYTIRDMTIKGKIYQDLNGTNGGIISWRNLDISSSGLFGDNDCTIIDRPGAGTRLLREHIDCKTITDGNVCHRDCGNVDIYDKGNTYTPLFSSSAENASQIYVRFNSTPCYYSDVGSAFNVTAAKTNGAMALTAYGWMGTDSGPCAGTGQAFIQGVTAIIRNTSANQGGSSAEFLHVYSGADELDEIYLDGVTALTSSSDPDDTVVRGYVSENSTTQAYVTGGLYRSTGGLINFDFTGGAAGKVEVVGVDYLTDDGNAVAGDQRFGKFGARLTVPVGALTCGAGTAGRLAGHTTPLQYCDNAGTPALRYAAYADSSGNASSVNPVSIDTDLVTVSFTPPGGDYQKELQLNNRSWWAHSSGSGSLSNFAVWDATDDRWEAASTSSIIGPTVVDYEYTGKVRFRGAPIASYTAGDPLTFNSGLTIDNGTSIPTVTVGGHLTVSAAGVTTLGTILRLTPVVTLPATCVAGEIQTKTDGALCHCYATNSWEQIGSQGVCL